MDKTNYFIGNGWPEKSSAKIIIIGLDTNGYTDIKYEFGDFFLEDFSKSELSRYQLSEGYKDFIITNYGDKPKSSRLIGRLYDRFPLDQRWQWEFRYNNFFKLSQVAKYGYVNILTLKDYRTSFVALNNLIRMNTKIPNMAEFTMDILIIEEDFPLTETPNGMATYI